jgi:hypothetical protein
MEYSCHGCGFSSPVVLIILDNAERINPEVAEFEVTGDLDRIAKGSRKIRKGNFLLVPF